VLNGLSPIFSIDMGSQASGMYVFTLMDAKGNSLTKKVIKE